MTLEEKKTLAWNQEQHRKWNSTTKEPLVPSHDAASSFINSNLKSLTSSKTLDSYSSLNSTSPNYMSNNWPSSIGMQPPQQPLSLGGSYNSFMQSPSCQPQSNFAFQSVPQGPPSLDLRSLDSLLPNIGGKPSIPMSQMNSRPVAPMNIIPKISSPPSYTSPVNSTAKSELDDLFG